MKFEQVAALVKDVPHMTQRQGNLIYELILDNEIEAVLELGSAHGTGSCYMAAALDEKKKGKVITIDNRSALNRKPNVQQLTERCGLDNYVNPIFASSTYNWELMKLIEQQTSDEVCSPMFDLCYLDGAHNFETDCCAFFLVQKLLKPGGFVLFDDLYWTYEKSPSLRNADWVKVMSEEERTTPHVKKLIDLVVLQHPDFHQASALEDWFLIRKKGDTNPRCGNVDLNVYAPETTVKEDFTKLVKNIIGRK